MPLFETADGPHLADEDYGAAAPIVFVFSWVLSADMREYQGYIRYGVPAGMADTFVEAYRKAGEVLEADPHCLAYEVARGWSSRSTTTPCSTVERRHDGRARTHRQGRVRPRRSSAGCYPARRRFAGLKPDPGRR